MAKEFAKKFYDSAMWKKCKKAYIDSRILVDGGMCEVCRSAPGEIVHHKKHLNESNINDEAVTLGSDNLMYVCHKCHDQFEGHGLNGKGSKRTCIFDEYGQPISIRDIDIPLGSSEF